MGLLRRIWIQWQKLGVLLANWLGQILLGIFYFTVLAPIGLAARLFGDILSIKASQKSSWVRYAPQDRNLDEIRRQY